MLLVSSWLAPEDLGKAHTVLQQEKVDVNTEDDGNTHANLMLTSRLAQYTRFLCTAALGTRAEHKGNVTAGFGTVTGDGPPGGQTVMDEMANLQSPKDCKDKMYINASDAGVFFLANLWKRMPLGAVKEKISVRFLTAEPARLPRFQRTTLHNSTCGPSWCLQILTLLLIMQITFALAGPRRLGPLPKMHIPERKRSSNPGMADHPMNTGMESKPLEFSSRTITGEMTVKGLSLNDLTLHENHRRLLQATQECTSEVGPSDGWALMLGGALQDSANAVATRADGKILVGGSTSSFSNGFGQDVLLAQFAGDGNLEWAKSVGGINDDSCNGIALSSNGNMILAGYTDGVGSTKHMLLAEFHQNGTLRWARSYSGPFTEYINAITIEDNGDIIATGSSCYASMDQCDILVARFSPSGDLLWAKLIGGAYDDEGFDIAVHPDNSGSIFVIGQIRMQYLGGKNALIANMAPNGTLQWSKILTDSEFTVGTCLAFNHDQELLIGGHSWDIGGGAYDIVVVQFDKRYNVKWASAIGGNTNDKANHIKVTTTGDIIVAGTSTSTSAFADSLLVRYTSSGDLYYAKTFGGDSGTDQTTSMGETTDGQIVIVGSSSSFGAGDYDAFLALFTSDLQIQSPGRNVRLKLVGAPLLLSQNYTARIKTDDWDPLVRIDADFGTTSWPLMYSTIISANAITPLSVLVNTTAFGLPDDAVLTFHYNYIMPKQPFLYVTSSVALELVANNPLETSGPDWLSYDSSSSVLSGTPLQTKTGQQHFRLISNTFVAPAVGALAGEVGVHLCVRGNRDISVVSSETHIFGGPGTEFVAQIATAPDGSVIAFGSTDSFGIGGFDWYVCLWDHSLQLLWAKTMGGAGDESSSAMVIRPDGKILLIGNTQSFGAGDDDVLIAELDGNGELAWATTIGGGTFDLGYDIAISSDGSFALTGTTLSYGVANYDWFVVTYRADGGLLWAKTFGGADEDDGYAVSFTSTNDLVLSGTSASFSSPKTRVVNVLTDGSGQIKWANMLQGGLLGDDLVYWSRMLPNDDFVLVGGTNSFGAGDYDALIMRLNGAGGIIWAKAFGGSAYDFVYGLDITHNDTLLVTGATASFGNGGNDAFILEIALNNGSLLSAYTYGGNGNDIGNYIVVTSKNDAIVIGSTQTYGAGLDDNFLINMTMQMDLLHTSSNHNLQPITGYEYVDCTFHVESITSNLTVTSPAPLVNNVTDLHTVPFTFFVDSISADYFRQTVEPIQRASFGIPFRLDFNTYLFSGTKVISITAAGKVTLPSFLQFDDDNKILYGTPSGNVRGEYLIDMVIQHNGQRAVASFIVHVPNSPPYYIGNQTFNTRTGRFVFKLAEFFRDDEEDRLHSYALAELDGELPPPIANLDPISGRLFGTTLSGDQGVYKFNVTVLDTFQALGWNVITVLVTNSAPRAQYLFTPPEPVTIGKFFSYTFPQNAFYDYDGDIINYGAIHPSFLTFNPSSRLLFGTPGTSDRGDHLVYFLASDGRAESNVSMVININAPPSKLLHLPLINLNPVYVPFSFQLPPSLYADADGDTIEYQLTSDAQHIVPSWLDFNSERLELSGTPTDNLHRPLPIRFKVSDKRGGEVFYDVSLAIPNSAPVLIYTIPSPPTAKSTIAWGFTLESDNFVDLDRDGLTYSASLANDSALPSWMSFNPFRRAFSGTPSGGDRGTVSIKITCVDALDAATSTFVNVSVINTAPQPIGRVYDQQTNDAVAAYSFTVSEFEDPDGDSITFAATLANGQPLPGWIAFDPKTLTFSTQPGDAAAGNYLLSLIANDTYGLSQKVPFNLAIQAVPKPSATEALLKNMGPIIAGMGLLMVTTSMLLWRKRRVIETNRRVRKWSATLHSTMTATSSDLVDFATLCRDLKSIGTQLSEGADLTAVESNLCAFEQRLRQYYAQPIPHRPMTMLLDTHIVEKLAKFAERNVLEVHPMDYSVHETLCAARLLHSFIGIILSEHTGRKHKLLQDTKSLYLDRLNTLISRVRCDSREDVEVLHELHNAREALICIADTNTLRLMCQQSMANLLSPGKLLGDLKSIAFDFPSCWYITLLELTLCASAAKRDIDALTRLQMIAATQGDWRFFYGLIPMLLGIMCQTANPSIRSQALTGQPAGKGSSRKLALFGYVHLLQRTNQHVNRWVQEQAQYSLKQVDIDFKGPEKALLATCTNGRQQATSDVGKKTVIRTPLEMRTSMRTSLSFVRRLTEVDDVTMSNPLHKPAGTGLAEKTAVIVASDATDREEPALARILSRPMTSRKKVMSSSGPVC